MSISAELYENIYSILSTTAAVTAEVAAAAIKPAKDIAKVGSGNAITYSLSGAATDRAGKYNATMIIHCYSIKNRLHAESLLELVKEVLTPTALTNASVRVALWREVEGTQDSSGIDAVQRAFVTGNFQVKATD